MMEQNSPAAEFLVAIGASAGGLEAIELFFRHCPNDLGVAYVVVQHLSPDHKSMMNDLLARYTDMPVVMVSSELVAQADTVYLIPAGTHIEVIDGRFSVTKKLPHTFSLPIDIFFKSVAKNYGSRCVAVVLSGTGSDGSLGINDISSMGGLVLVQKPDESRFDGMPVSAINTGVVDQVIAAAEMPAKISAYVLSPHAKEVPTDYFSHDDNINFEPLQDIFNQLNNAYNIDFREYKAATVSRRIERRMQQHHLAELSSYAAMCRDDNTELDRLRVELLIPVTSFFRDPKVFSELQERIVPAIIDAANRQQGVRIWVAGTSTGEEAYSLAMLFIEAFEKRKAWLPLKIFATDVNQDNLDVAAAGRYPPTIVSEISQLRLEKFFEQDDHGYVVKPFLRQCIVFARHNLLTDAPFTRMHLVSCRNTLIYFRNAAQEIALQKLQFAVQPESYLLLGISESLLINAANFTVLDSKLKLFQRNHKALQADIKFGLQLQPTRSNLRDANIQAKRLSPEERLTTQAKDWLLQHYSPASLLVDTNGKILHLYGDLQHLLQVRHGNAEMTLNKLLPDKLIPVASALLYKCRREGGQFSSEFVRFTDNSGADVNYQVQVSALNQQAEENYYLLSFVQGKRQTELPATPVELHHELSEKIYALEMELQATRESLQSTIEELETSNEELQATNEELMASNEEMQSANEELQSVNEELNTVNAEYHEKMNILNRINADLDSMSRAAGIASIFIDEQRRITRYTPDALKLFKLREHDIGRPLDEVVHVLHYPDFGQDVASTLEHERGIEKEVNTETGDDLLVRILPYRITSGTLGAVASFIDITPLKLSEQLQVLVNALPEHIAVLDKFGQIILVNTAWEQFARVNGDPDLSKTCVGTNYLTCCQQSAAEEPMAHKAYLGVKSVLEGSKASFHMSYPCHSPTEQRWFVMNVTGVKHGHFAAVVSHTNVTDWVQRELHYDGQ